MPSSPTAMALPARPVTGQLGHGGGFIGRCNGDGSRLVVQGNLSTVFWSSLPHQRHVPLEVFPGLARPWRENSWPVLVGGAASSAFIHAGHAAAICPATMISTPQDWRLPTKHGPSSSIAFSRLRSISRRRKCAERAPEARPGARDHRDDTYPLPNPFLVYWHADPLETEGT